MNEYIISVSAMALAVTVGALILHKNGTEKTARSAMSLILLAGVVIPIVSAVTHLTDSDFRLEGAGLEENINNTAYAECARDAYGRGVGDYVSEKFKIDRSDIKVYIYEFDVEKMTCGRVRIILSGRGITADTRRIRESVESEGLGKCEVVIEASG